MIDYMHAELQRFVRKYSKTDKIGRKQTDQQLTNIILVIYSVKCQSYCVSAHLLIQNDTDVLFFIYRNLY